MSVKTSRLCDRLLANKGKDLLFRVMKTLGGSDWATTRPSRFIPLPPLPSPRYKPLHPLNGWQGGPQSRFEYFGEGKNNTLPLPELEPRIIQRVTSHYTDCATPDSVTLHKKPSGKVLSSICIIILMDRIYYNALNLE